MPTDLEKLALVVDDEVLIRPCVDIMALSTTPKADGAAGYVAFYEAFNERFGDQLTVSKLSNSRKWKKLTPKERVKVPFWFTDKKSLKAPLLGIKIHAGEGDDLTPPMFEMMFDHAYPDFPRGMFRIVLDTSFVADGADSLLELIDAAMDAFPVHWGTAGYSFLWNDLDSRVAGAAEQWIGRHLKHHPGLTTGFLIREGSWVEQGVGNLSWTTFLGDALVDKVGGVDALEAAVAPEAKVRRYQAGVAIVAGDRPELGSVNKNDTLPELAKVGAALDPVRLTDDAFGNLGTTGIPDADESLAWRKRFFPT